ncbi:unnamed protein product [Strongylus vulgaris]|uniref:Uncharacterized protein n=1 Tax=Strongylus vulgaris TaxID=40348 RepID=A0A3P7LP88_STRVU|nr:unnamed protein product [Strongylus vulgaris]
MGVRQIQRLQRMMVCHHSAASPVDYVVVDAPCCVEKGVKIGVDGGCPGVVCAEHETISMAISEWLMCHFKPKSMASCAT